MITKEMSVADVVKAYPGVVDLFNDFHIDYCCGGKDNLELAIEQLGIDSKSFIDLLNKNRSKGNQKKENNAINIEQRKQMSLTELIDYICQTHHEKEREMLEELDALINKIFIVHYEHHSEQLTLLHGLFSDLRKELQEHFVKEEKLTFPYMKESYLSDARDIQYVKELEDEHDAAGDLVKQIESCTNDFTAPDDGCPTYELTFKKLKELTEDLYLHIFTENSILFPIYEGGQL